MSSNIAILASLPLSSALAGWIVARWMFSSLWKSGTPQPTGIIPRNWTSITEKAAAFATPAVQKLVPELAGDIDISAITPLVEAHLDTYLRIRLKEKLPVIAAFVGESTILKLKASMMEEIQELLPQVINQYVKSIGNSPELSHKIAQAIAGISPAEIDRHIAPHLSKLRNSAQWVAAAIGCLPGLMLAMLFYFVGIA